jgi:signal recognition particle receptor subunit beta
LGCGELKQKMLTVTTGTQGLIFVIDSSDRVRIEEARQELHRIINDREMKESLLLVFANKQDIQGGTYPSDLHEHSPLTVLAMKPQEVTDALKLQQLKDKIWFVVPSCATTGEGLLEGLARSKLYPIAQQANLSFRHGSQITSNPHPTPERNRQLDPRSSPLVLPHHQPHISPRP